MGFDLDNKGGKVLIYHCIDTNFHVAVFRDWKPSSVLILVTIVVSWQGHRYCGGWNMGKRPTGTFCIMPSLWISLLARSGRWRAMSHGGSMRLSAGDFHITPIISASQLVVSLPLFIACVCVHYIRHKSSVLFLELNPLQDLYLHSLQQAV